MALTDPIHVKTRIVPIARHGCYEALSYVWGDQSTTTTVGVDGLPVVVTQTLASALRYIRLKHETRTVWADQLSIDQANAEEKRIQIPLMTDIYTRTTQCLVWMGEFGPNIDTADGTSAFQILESMASRDALPQHLATPEDAKTPMVALATILPGQNAWWDRMWTLQEAVLPKKAALLWGSLAIDWDTVERAMANFCEGRLRDRGVLSEVVHSHAGLLNGLSGQVRGLQFDKQQQDQRERTTFDDRQCNCISPNQECNKNGLLSAWRWGFRKATDPLDHVYGFMGLFANGNRRLPLVEQVDYGRSLGSLYARFTVDLIRYDDSLRPIALDHHVSTRQWLPGWAHDLGNRWTLDVEIKDADVGGFYLFEGYGRHDASGGASVSDCEFDVDSNELTIAGRCVDKIAVAGEKLQSDGPDSKCVSDQTVVACLGKWFDQCEEFLSGMRGQEDSRGPALWPESFWRGLMNTDKDLDRGMNYLRTGRRIEDNATRNDTFTCMSLRTMFITEAGFVGFGPRHLETGDEIWILRGGNVPFVVRPNGRTHSFIGSAFVDGLMRGEGVQHCSWADRVTLL